MDKYHMKFMYLAPTPFSLHYNVPKTSTFGTLHFSVHVQTDFKDIQVKLTNSLGKTDLKKTKNSKHNQQLSFKNSPYH